MALSRLFTPNSAPAPRAAFPAVLAIVFTVLLAAFFATVLAASLKSELNTPRPTCLQKNKKIRQIRYIIRVRSIFLDKKDRIRYSLVTSGYTTSFITPLLSFTSQGKTPPGRRTTSVSHLNASKFVRQ